MLRQLRCDGLVLGRGQQNIMFAITGMPIGAPTYCLVVAWTGWFSMTRKQRVGVKLSGFAVDEEF